MFHAVVPANQAYNGRIKKAPEDIRMLISLMCISDKVVGFCRSSRVCCFQSQLIHRDSCINLGSYSEYVQIIINPSLLSMPIVTNMCIANAEKCSVCTYVYAASQS